MVVVGLVGKASQAEGVRWASLPESLPPGGQIDTEQKYCAHCSGGISEGPNEGDGSQFTCPECGGFFHRYRLNCHPDRFHAEPPASLAPGGPGVCTTCHSSPGYWRWREPWVASRYLCTGCFEATEHPASRDACCGKDIVAQGGICTDCPHAPPEFRTHPDPAVAQLQRAVKQAGERLAALESIHDHGARGIGHGFLIDRLCVLEGRVDALEGDAHTPVENEYDRLAALEVIHADGTREDGSMGHGFLAPGKRIHSRLDALAGKLIAVRSRVGNLEAGQILSSPALLEKRIAVLEGDKRNAPWLEVWGSTARLYSAVTMAKALGLSYDFVREKLSDYLATDEPAEVAEPGGFRLSPPGRRPNLRPGHLITTTKEHSPWRSKSKPTSRHPSQRPVCC